MSGWTVKCLQLFIYVVCLQTKDRQDPEDAKHVEQTVVGVDELSAEPVAQWASDDGTDRRTESVALSAAKSPTSMSSMPNAACQDPRLVAMVMINPASM